MLRLSPVDLNLPLSYPGYQNGAKERHHNDRQNDCAILVIKKHT
jgi:hypothetical protein